MSWLIGILFIIGVVLLLKFLIKLTKTVVSAVVLTFVTVVLIFGLVGLLSYTGYVDLNSVPGGAFVSEQTNRVTAFVVKASDIKDTASAITEKIREINITAGES